MSENKDKDTTEPEAKASAKASDDVEAKPEAKTDANGEAADAKAEASAAPAAGDVGTESTTGERDEGAEQGELYGLLAEFKSPGALIAAAAKVRDAGYTKWDCYSPFPVHGLDPAMGIKRTILPWIVFLIGLGGMGGGLFLQWWTNAHYWPWLVSGKPFFSLPANIPITFETTILASVFASFFGMWGLNKLPQHWHPFFKKDRFRKATDNGFFIGIEAEDAKFQRGKTQALLEEAGAVAIESAFIDRSPAVWALPRPVVGFIVVSAVAALVPFALIAKARASKSPDPHYQLLTDMDYQPKAQTQQSSALFANSRASRVRASGTVARGDALGNEHFYQGLTGGDWATAFPPELEISMRTVERGKQRFDIYCQPCHGTDAGGQGMIHQRSLKVPVRGWVQPTNLNQEFVIRQPHGQLFNTISNGIRTMPGYSAQIPEVDRWAIVLYLRALQRSQNANLDDVPPDARQQIR